MQKYIRKLKAIIADEVKDCDSVLDSLFWAHCEKAEGDSGVVQELFEENTRRTARALTSANRTD